MSGLVKGIKKVFKKVTKFVKKYWKYVAVAVAVYFTAGVALSYFGSTAAFASSMPGFGVGGMFSKAAVAIGFQGSSAVASGLSMTSGAFGAGTAAAGALVAPGTTAAAAAAPGSGVTLAGIGSAPTATTAAYTGQAAAATAGQAAATTGATVGGAAAATESSLIMKAASTAFKLQAASTLISAVGGLFTESQSDINKKEHEMKWGNAFGVGRDGSTKSGWASSGGSDAFKNMGQPPRMGDSPVGGIAGSTQQAPFLADNNQQQAPQPQSQPVEGGGDFIQSGYENKGYMPYA